MKRNSEPSEEFWSIEALDMLSSADLETIDEDIAMYEAWVPALKALREAVVHFRRSQDRAICPIDISALFPDEPEANAIDADIATDVATDATADDSSGESEIAANETKEHDNSESEPPKRNAPDIADVRHSPLDMADACRSFLEKNGPSTVAEIAAGVGCRPVECGGVLGSMKRFKRAVRVAGGKWRLAKPGDFPSNIPGELKNGFREIAPLKPPSVAGMPSLASISRRRSLESFSGPANTDLSGEHGLSPLAVRIKRYLEINQPAKTRIIAADLNEESLEVEDVLKAAGCFSSDYRGWMIAGNNIADEDL